MKAVRRRCEDYYLCKRCFENQRAFLNERINKADLNKKNRIETGTMVEDETIDGIKLSTEMDFDSTTIYSNKHRSDEGIGIGGIIACDVVMSNKN